MQLVYEYNTRKPTTILIKNVTSVMYGEQQLLTNHAYIFAIPMLEKYSMKKLRGTRQGLKGKLLKWNFRLDFYFLPHFVLYKTWNMFKQMFGLESQVIKRLTNPQGASYFENIDKKCHLPSLTNMDDIFYYHVWISIFEVEDQT